MYPTVLAATGVVATNQIQPLDGISLLPLFERKTESRAKPIPFWSNVRNHNSHAALLDWPYKLHTNPAAGRAPRGGNAEATLPVVLLYDVSKDPTETNNIAATQPERVAKMTAALEAWKESVEKSFAGADYATTPRK
jgi:arylsulfatase A-like enzyme